MGGYRITDPETCRLAYEEMKEAGTLSTRRLEIACVLSQQSKPKTAGQLAKGLNKNRNNVATRLSEMSHLGVVEKVNEVECPTTGKICWTWQMTGHQPSGSVPKGASKSQLYKKERDAANAKVSEFIKMTTGLAKVLNRKNMTKTAKQLQKRTEEILAL